MQFQFNSQNDLFLEHLSKQRSGVASLVQIELQYYIPVPLLHGRVLHRTKQLAADALGGEPGDLGDDEPCDVVQRAELFFHYFLFNLSLGAL